MTSALEALAGFLKEVTPSKPQQERLRRHMADTLAMLQVGRQLEDGRAAALVSTPLVANVAAIRCTEGDDIHLSSCSTPGSVIVPVALQLAAEGDLNTWPEFTSAVLAGYEMLIRLAYAIDGPRVLGKKIWPTLYAAPLGAAAVACRAWKLNQAQAANALATAMASSTGVAAPASSGHSSRWVTLGWAANTGVLAAQAARQGMGADAGLIERYRGRLGGVGISTERLLAGLGRRFLFDDTGMKPYPIARQALAAVEASRQLVREERLRPADISEIVVFVPKAQARVIDHRGELHPQEPAHRLASIASVRHQIAAALGTPSLHAKVRVETDSDLEKQYPETWPARVRISQGRRRVERTLLHPRGDSKNPLTWREILAKCPEHAAVIEVIRGARDPVFFRLPPDASP